MSDPKTKKNKSSVTGYLARIPDERTRADCRVLVDMMREASGEKPAMWGPSIIGFGSYHYKYPTGREGDMPIIGFSPRTQNLTLYIWHGAAPHKDLMKKLGKYKTGVGCLYIKRLEDVHLPTLKKLIRRSVKIMRTKGYGNPS